MSDSTFVFIYITQIVTLIQTKYSSNRRYILINVGTSCKYDTKISVWFYPFLKYKKKTELMIIHISLYLFLFRK